MPGSHPFTHGSMGRTESMDRYRCWRTEECELEMEVDVDWLTVEPRKGKTVWDGSGDERIWVSVDWDRVPASTKGETVEKEGHIEFSATDRTNVTISVPIIIPPSPQSSFRGHVEGDGYVVIETAHYTRNTSAEGYAFEELEGYGRTLPVWKCSLSQPKTLP